MTPTGSTVSAFAAAFDLPHVRAYRIVKHFVGLELLRVLRTERRAGRPIQHYVCPQRQYFLPASLVSIEEYLQESFQPYEGQIKLELARSAQSGPDGVAGLLVGAFGDGVALVPADRHAQPWNPEQPGGPALYYGIGALHLEYAQARQFQQELQAIFERYGRQDGPARYLYQVMFTPDSRG